MKLSELVTKFENMDISVNGGSQTLTDDQAYIFRDIIKTYKNRKYALLDARSGSGKTTLIRALQKYCSQQSIRLVVTASTGKASSALGGQTIHKYLDLKMVINEDAEKKEDALILSSKNDSDRIVPDILIIDEASMIGEKLLKSIKSANFPFVFFVMDSEQLPPVKEKKVDWEKIVDVTYTLTKTLRAKDPKLTKLFDDFKAFKDSGEKTFDLMSYINQENIVKIDWSDCDFIPRNSQCTVVGYRNALVEYLADKLTTKFHNMYCLNTGITETRMVADLDAPLNNGYYKRDFKDVQVLYNGEDVKIDILRNETEQLVKYGFCKFNGYTLSLNKNKTGITVSTHQSSTIEPYAKESSDDKCYISFPPDDVLEYTTLACVNDKHFILFWDGTEDEFNNVLEDKFKRLFPYLKTQKTCKTYYKNFDKLAIECLDSDIQDALIENRTYKDFSNWYQGHRDTSERSNRWKDYLSTNKIVSARVTTARSVHKSQGMSIPCIVITDQSFYGASLSAQYVALTRGKHGVILIENTPEDWKNKDKGEEYDY